MSSFVYLAAAAVLIILDQIIKAWAIQALQPVQSIMIINGLLSFTYVENRGAAFGILQGKYLLLMILTALILIGAYIILLSGKFIKRPLEKISLSLIVAGGTGNFIDRTIRGFVVDYIDINQLFTFPMFNLADCCVCVGAFLLLITVFMSEKTKSAVDGGEVK